MSLRCLAWSLAAVGAASAAEPRFRHYGAAEGLPSPATLEVTQDTLGYVWVATGDGLARFDGREFRVFRNDPAEPASLPCNDVQTVLATRGGRILVGCESAGLAVLDDPVAQRFAQLPADPAGDGLRGGDVFALAETAAGQVYVGTYAQGLARYRPASGDMQALDRIADIDATLRSATVLDMAVDHAGVLWVGTLDALWRIEAADAERPGPASRVLELPLVNTVAVTADGSLWVGAQGTLLHRAGADSRLQPVPLPDDAGIVESVIDGGPGETWVATRGGVLRLHGSGRDWIRHRPAVTESLPDAHVTDLLRDHEGGLWFALQARGLAYLRPDWARMQLLRHDPLDSRSLSPGRASGIAACADGSLWMLATAGELTRVDAEGNVLRWTSTRHARALRTQRLAAIHCDADNVLWLPHRAGVLRFDPQRDVLLTFPAAGEPWAEGAPEYIAQTADGTVWVGALTAGLNELRASGEVRVWRVGERGFVSDDIEQMTVGPDGRLWLADALGLRSYDPASDRFVAAPSVPAERVHTFVFESPQALVLHQFGRLARYRIDAPVWTPEWTLGAEQGLPAAEAASLLVDGDERLWLSGPRGLWRLERGALRLTAVSAAEGLPAVQFSSKPSALVQRDALWWLTQEGLLRIDGEAQAIATPASPLRWSSLRYLHEDAAAELDPHRAPLQFGPDDHELRIGTRLLSYVDPQANRYRFRIDGFDADWVEASALGERVVARLPPGRFRVDVQASNALGVTANAMLTSTLLVAPPWWASPYAYVGYALLALLLFALMWRANRARLERRHAMDLAEERRRHAEAASEAKSEFLATVGHEIRTPMTGVLGHAELLASTRLDGPQRHHVDSVLRSGRHLLRIVNDLLDLSRAEVGKLSLNLAPADLHAVLQEVHALEAPLIRARGIACTLELAPDLPRHVRVDATRLRQILLNLLNNALKFTERGEVRLGARRDDDGVVISVSDTGPGMTAAECARLFQRFEQTSLGERNGGSGLGLAIVHQLAQLMGGRVELQSTPGSGSCFTVHLPLVECADAASGDVDDADAAPTSAAPVSTLELAADPARPLHARCVLLVEDDAATREVLAALLAELGAEVRAAAQAMQALHHADATVALIVSDLDLPGMNGLQLLPLLRQRIAAPVPAIAVTARSEANTEQDARHAGFDAFLRKPITRDLLRAALLSLARAPT